MVLHYKNGFKTMNFSTAKAKAMPSKVDVPRPSSSSTTRELCVPKLSTFRVSSISTKNVLYPSANLSLAPILTNILSTAVKRALDAGTQHPIYPRMTAIQTERQNVLLPDMFGPVMKTHCLCCERSMSFAMNGLLLLLEIEDITG